MKSVLLLQPLGQKMTRGFVRIHCGYCDAILGWQDMDSYLMGFQRLTLCDDCYINKRPVDVCFHCGITHKHKITMVDDEYSVVADDDSPILPDELFKK